MTGIPANVVDYIVGLSRERKFAEAVAYWRSLRDPMQFGERAARLVAASMAQTGALDDARALLTGVTTKFTSCEAATHALLGRITFDLGDFEHSKRSWALAHARDPENSAWWRWYAESCIKANDVNPALEAAAPFRIRFNTEADLAIVYANLLVAAHRCDEALIEFRRILARWPRHPFAGPAFSEFVVTEFPDVALDLLESTAWRANAPALSPGEVRAAARLPAIYTTSASARMWRARFVAEMRRLEALALASPLAGNERAVCLSSSAFFVPYADQDVTEAQFAWGDFLEALAGPLRSEFRPLVNSSAIRCVGVVSNRISDSSAGRVFNPWLYQLRDAGFNVRVYAIGPTDHVSDQIARDFDVYRIPEERIEAWRPLAERIFRDKNDVLVFPEPQGSHLLLLLAAIRLAPIQCAGFGNPVTTGLHTMDYFLSPDDAEVNWPEKQYREQVVRIRDAWALSVTPPPPEPDMGRATFGLTESDHVYIASQQLQKWTPDFVDTVVELVQRDSNAHLIFFAVGWGVSVRAFELMLSRKFDAAGLSYGNRVHPFPLLSRDRYLALHAVADVGLDTFGFSGGSSIVDSLSVELPIVTLEGVFLRGRQSASLLRQHGAGGNIVRTREAYIQRAIELASLRRTTKASAHGSTAEGSGADVSPHAPLEDVVRSMKSFATVDQFLKSLGQTDQDLAY